LTKPKINVLNDFCKEYENLPLNTPILLSFKMDGRVSYYEIDDYTVTLTCSNRTVSISTTKFIVQAPSKFNTYIQSTTEGDASIVISVDGSFNAKFSFKFMDSKDVFKKDGIDLLKDELLYIKLRRRLRKYGWLDSPERDEYGRNGGHGYCMGTAERGLSQLLGDTTNFYACERVTDKHLNKISFTGKNATAKGRGKHFHQLGYTEEPFTFEQNIVYKINYSKANLILHAKNSKDADDQYGNEEVEYGMIELTASGKTSITEKFKKDIKVREWGYHVYYITVTDGFHTLLLIIDNITDPCNPTYEIWDQDAKSKSYGFLTDIAEGLRRQTSWTFANSCLNRYRDKNTGTVDTTTTFLWKIRRKK
jgi:hypothetical protein